jgi:hypothetical protein
MVYKSRLHKAVGNMVAQKLNVSRPFVTNKGDMVFPVNGYLLTVPQILELDSKNELTSWGIRDFTKQLEGKSREISLC